MATAAKTLEGAYLQLHLEPDEPLEIGELTGALNAFSRRYQQFASEQEAAGQLTGGKLLIASVAPGSIDINFIPDFVVATAPLLPVMVDQAASLVKFSENLKTLFGVFAGKEKPAREPTVKDCDDAVGIFNPIATHGGTQTFNVFKDATIIQQVIVQAPEAQRVVEGAVRKRAELQFPKQATRQRVSMIWKRLDRGEAKTEGVRSPDLGLIEEIDPKPHAILFTDEMTYLKREMIGDDENPYGKVYYVDVEVSRVAERVTGYRITGYHGRDDFDGASPEASAPSA